MPIDTGVRPLKILAVVGTVGAGKTHFLASALHAAFHDQSLLPYGYSEFFPDEATAYRFDELLFEPIVAAMKAAHPTTVEEFTPYLPLCFRVSRGQQAVTVLIHDIPGEALMDRQAKARYLPFLRNAHGLIFLIDPKYLTGFRGKVDPDRPRADKQSGFTQSNLVLNCLSEMNQRASFAGGVKPHIGMAISKSDILPRLLDRTFEFSSEGPDPSEREAWIADRKAVTEEVRQVLISTSSRDLLSIADNNAGAVLHAVAPIGMDKRLDERDIHFHPLRCTEVIAGALDGILGAEDLDWTGN